MNRKRTAPKTRKNTTPKSQKKTVDDAPCALQKIGLKRYTSNIPEGHTVQLPKDLLTMFFSEELIAAIAQLPTSEHKDDEEQRDDVTKEGDEA